MRATRLLLCLTVVGALAACSGDDGLSAEEQDLADAWATTLQDDESGLSAGPEDAACMGDAIMAELGTDPFDDAEVSAEDITVAEDSNSPGELLGDGVITDAEADAILDVWDEDCVDLVVLLTESVAGELELDAEAEACFAAGLEDDDLARGLLRASFTSGNDTPPDDALAALQGLVGSCGGGESTIADAIAESLAADGAMTEEQAQCVGQAVVDTIGVARLTELAAGGDFEDADPAAQQELAGALVEAAATCDVPVSALGG